MGLKLENFLALVVMAQSAAGFSLFPQPVPFGRNPIGSGLAPPLSRRPGSRWAATAELKLKKRVLALKSELIDRKIELIDSLIAKLEKKAEARESDSLPSPLPAANEGKQELSPLSRALMMIKRRLPHVKAITKRIFGSRAVLHRGRVLSEQKPTKGKSKTKSHKKKSRKSKKESSNSKKLEKEMKITRKQLKKIQALLEKVSKAETKIQKGVSELAGDRPAPAKQSAKKSSKKQKLKLVKTEPYSSYSKLNV